MVSYRHQHSARLSASQIPFDLNIRCRPPQFISDFGRRRGDQSVLRSLGARGRGGWVDGQRAAGRGRRTWERTHKTADWGASLSLSLYSRSLQHRWLLIFSSSSSTRLPFRLCSLAITVSIWPRKWKSLLLTRTFITYWAHWNSQPIADVKSVSGNFIISFVLIAVISGNKRNAQWFL